MYAYHYGGHFGEVVEEWDDGELFVTFDGSWLVTGCGDTVPGTERREFGVVVLKYSDTWLGDEGWGYKCDIVFR